MKIDYTDWVKDFIDLNPQDNLMGDLMSLYQYELEKQIIKDPELKYIQDFASKVLGRNDWGEFYNSRMVDCMIRDDFEHFNFWYNDRNAKWLWSRGCRLGISTGEKSFYCLDENKHLFIEYLKNLISNKMLFEFGDASFSVLNPGLSKLHPGASREKLRQKTQTFARNLDNKKGFTFSKDVFDCLSVLGIEVRIVKSK